MTQNTTKTNKVKKILSYYNPRTILGQLLILATICVLAVLVWFFTVTGMSVDAYINTTADNTSFNSEYDSTGSSLTNVENAVRMKGSDFTEFNVLLECQTYNEESSSATYRAYYYKNEKTIKLSGQIDTRLLLTADYVNKKLDSENYESMLRYNSSTIKLSGIATTLDSARSSSTYYKNYSLSNLMNFPLNSTTLYGPYTLTKAETPIVYLYLNYTEVENNRNVQRTYILRYDYSDYEILSGGIVK